MPTEISVCAQGDRCLRACAAVQPRPRVVRVQHISDQLVYPGAGRLSGLWDERFGEFDTPDQASTKFLNAAEYVMSGGNDKVALTFWWTETERQIRIQGLSILNYKIKVFRFDNSDAFIF